MIIFFIGLCTTILGVAGVEGSLPLWQVFLIGMSGIIIMFGGVIKMSYQGSEYID